MFPFTIHSRTEQTLMQMDTEIKKSLNTESMDVDKCVAILEDVSKVIASNFSLVCSRNSSVYLKEIFNKNCCFASVCLFVCLSVCLSFCLSMT